MIVFEFQKGQSGQKVVAKKPESRMKLSPFDVLED